VKRPYRMALGYLLAAEAFGDGAPGLAGATDLADPGHPAAAFLARLDPRETALVRQQVARRLNAPVASSAGRLFDAAAALIGIRDVAEYEAHAAIDLELAAGERIAPPLPYRLERLDGLVVYDPRPTLAALLEGAAGGRSKGSLAAAFQATVAEVTREILAGARTSTGIATVCLSGGVFQNRRLASSLLRDLARDGFRVLINRQVPVNDGGVSYGQAAVAAARLGSGASGAPRVED
jgi:hydrogenase maturation protein HypF